MNVHTFVGVCLCQCIHVACTVYIITCVWVYMCKLSCSMFAIPTAAPTGNFFQVTKLSAVFFMAAANTNLSLQTIVEVRERLQTMNGTM